MPVRKTTSLASIFSDAPEALKKTPTREALKGAKEQLSGTAGDVLKAIESFSPFKGGVDKLKDQKGKPVLAALIGFMAYMMKPEVEKEDGKKSDSKQSSKKLDQIQVKVAEDPEIAIKVPGVELGTIAPKAAPEQVLAITEGNIKKLKDLEKKCRQTGDFTPLRNLVFLSVAKTESGSGNNSMRLRLVNQGAVGPKTRRMLLEEKRIIVPAYTKKHLFPNQSFLESYAAFKKQVCSVLQPNLPPGPKRTSNAAEILARCAVGKYQVLPIYWVKGVKGKKSMGDAELRAMYDYFKSPGLQQRTALSIIERHGKRYDWNPAHIMLAYYAGTKWADHYKKNPTGSAFARGQNYKHGSMLDYMKKTTRYANELLAQKKA